MIKAIQTCFYHVRKVQGWGEGERFYWMCTKSQLKQTTVHWQGQGSVCVHGCVHVTVCVSHPVPKITPLLRMCNPQVVVLTSLFFQHFITLSCIWYAYGLNTYTQQTHSKRRGSYEWWVSWYKASQNSGLVGVIHRSRRKDLDTVEDTATCRFFFPVATHGTAEKSQLTQEGFFP